MLKLPIDQDEMLKQLAAESMRKGEDIRATVRDLTLKALQGRQLTLGQIRDVLRTVADGVNVGASKTALNPESMLSDAMAGMDDAMLKAVEANRVALDKLTGNGATFEQSQMKKALDELERYEDTLLRSIKQASSSATERVKAQWAGVLKNSKLEGTDTGARVAATLEQYGSQMQNAMRESRAAGLKVAHSMTRNYATLVSGVLIGLSEGLQQTPPMPRATPSSAPARAAPKAVAKKAPAKKAPAKKAAKKVAAKKRK